MKITKKGDGGETSIGSGRVSKSSDTIIALGEIDHLTSMIGVLMKDLESQEGKQNSSYLEMSYHLTDIQKDLYHIMCDVAGWSRKIYLEISRVDFIDSMICDSSEKIEIKEFQTCQSYNCYENLCRTQTRKVECMLHKIDFNNKDLIYRYINRLSSYFFALGLNRLK